VSDEGGSFDGDRLGANIIDLLAGVLVLDLRLLALLLFIILVVLLALSSFSVTKNDEKSSAVKADPGVSASTEFALPVVRGLRLAGVVDLIISCELLMFLLFLTDSIIFAAVDGLSSVLYFTKGCTLVLLNSFISSHLILLSSSANSSSSITCMQNSHLFLNSSGTSCISCTAGKRSGKVISRSSSESIFKLDNPRPPLPPEASAEPNVRRVARCDFGDLSTSPLVLFTGLVLLLYSLSGEVSLLAIFLESTLSSSLLLFELLSELTT
jgi:hypothetical protein